MYISLTQQQLRNVVDVNGRLYIALTDADDHGRSIIQKLVSGVRTPKLHKSLQPWLLDVTFSLLSAFTLSCIYRARAVYYMFI